MAEEMAPEFEDLLTYLSRDRGFDFTGYKRASLQRRVDRRMTGVGVQKYEDYVAYLEVHPHEFVMLFNTILINVTGFFRDENAWTLLREEVLPAHVARLPSSAPIRAWSAGCASGEEAYSIAMTLAEILGPEQFAQRVKVYGTDVDEEALTSARQATYSTADVSGVPEVFLEKYFEQIGDRFSFRSDLRRSVIFGRLDLLHDSPISRLELLTCRNTLMYFNSESQAQVISRFRFGLNDGGLLFLGKAETLLSGATTFEPIDRKWRIFRNVSAAAGGDETADAPLTRGVRRDGGSMGSGLPLSAFNALPMATLLFDSETTLVEVNDRARLILGLSGTELGAVFQDLEVSYRPVDLRTPMYQAASDLMPKHLSNIEMSVDGVLRIFDIDIVPLADGLRLLGTCVMFHDRTKQRELQERLHLAALELEQAYQELQSTNEELETTNEELQSTIEELETTNEELQSTNEELETMNEELQSTNDELHAVNEELGSRSDEIDELNRFLESILASFRGGVVVLSLERKVLMWNAEAADLWGLRLDEVAGADFLDLDIGLPVHQLADALDAALAGERTEVELDAVTRRGRLITCQVSMSPLHRDEPVGAIMLMEISERAV